LSERFASSGKRRVNLKVCESVRQRQLLHELLVDRAGAPPNNTEQGGRFLHFQGARQVVLDASKRRDVVQRKRHQHRVGMQVLGRDNSALKSRRAAAKLQLRRRL